MNDIPINSDLSEIVKYNNPNFPAYILKGLLSTYPNYKATCHWHNDIEFIYVYDGSMDYFINGSIVSLTEGQGIFVNSRCLHYGFSDAKNECSFLCVLLHPDLLTSNEYFVQNILNPFLYNESIPYIHLRNTIKWQANILKLLSDMNDALNKPNASLEIIHICTTIFYTLINHADYVNIRNHNQQDLDTLALMVGYVQQHYTEKITTTNLTKAGNCCKTKCNNLFRDYLNTSPINYIITYRLDKSIGLLSKTDLNITDVSFQCGFSTTSYFCETFHKFYGVTPKQYRAESSRNSTVV